WTVSPDRSTASSSPVPHPKWAPAAAATWVSPRCAAPSRAASGSRPCASNPVVAPTCAAAACSTRPRRHWPARNCSRATTSADKQRPAALPPPIRAGHCPKPASLPTRP
ncbi:MAG: hypothetical protein AVDCRST_MAG51-2486, partial [uncultured Ramlibacter sp.]